MSNAETIPPALTAEEWAKAQGKAEGYDWFSLADAEERAEWISQSVNCSELPAFHRVAALALYQQPFGFTVEELATLDRYVESHRGVTEEAEVFALLAAKIRALLPK